MSGKTHKWDSTVYRSVHDLVIQDITPLKRKMYIPQLLKRQKCCMTYNQDKVYIYSTTTYFTNFSIEPINQARGSLLWTQEAGKRATYWSGWWQESWRWQGRRSRCAYLVTAGWVEWRWGSPLSSTRLPLRPHPCPQTARPGRSRSASPQTVGLTLPCQTADPLDLPRIDVNLNINFFALNWNPPNWTKKYTYGS